MRIAVVHSFYSSRAPSGENEAVLAEVAALARRGHDVELLARHTDALERRPTYPMECALRVGSGAGRSPLRRGDGRRFDVVHVHNLFPNFGRSWLRSLRLPLAVTVHNYRPVCANGYLFRDGGPCTLCPDGKPSAAVRHRCFRGSALATLPVALAARRGVAGDRLLARAAAIRLLSEPQARRYHALGLQRPVSVVPNFLPASLDPGAAPAPAGEHAVVVARLSPEKGVAALVEQWGSERPLLVVGDGPQRQTIEAAARRRAVHVLGALPREAVVDVVRRAAALVVPSRWFEVLPLVYVEALAAGTPVVATRPNAVAELATEERTGRAVGALREVDAAISAVVAGGDELRRHCRAVFEARYTEARVIEQLEQFLTAAAAAIG